MGAVWRGEHGRSGQPVAVKLLTARSVDDPSALRSFRAEVRAAARLHHESIVRLYDHGTAGTETAAASGGELPVGTPWIAMELVSGTTLADHCGRLAWPLARSVLLHLLDGLAHAHARGVFHRDLKPANVLVSGDFQTVKLTDFGIAHLVEDQRRDVPFASGTPSYMSPEQLDARWREYGPWTDLYALGCLAWVLMTGDAPFGDARSLAELYDAHQTRAPPPFLSIEPAPEGLEAWLGRLLEKQPRDRFQCAADAAWELLQMPEGGIGRTVRRGAIRADDPGTNPTRRWTRTLSDLQYAAREARSVAASGPVRPGLAGLPPVPAGWRGRAPTRADPPMVGAGLRLYPWRQIPMVGREAERDRLWLALRAVAEERAPRCVVLRGHAGVGKSRLASWLSERAHEVGVARVVALGAGPSLTSDLAHHLRCAGLSADRVADRLATALGHDGTVDQREVRALAALLSPRSRHVSGGGTVVQIRSDSERRAVAVRLVVRMARQRPLVLLVEDLAAHAGVEAMQLVAEVLDHEVPLPVLVIGTVGDETLGRGSDEADELERLLARPNAESLALEPMPRRESRTLLRELLHLERDLAQEVEARTAGNPLFAVQLIGSWVQRGLLVSGPHGFRLEESAGAWMPEDLHGVWSERIGRLLRGRADGDARSLELAAAQGRSIDVGLWLEACARVGVRPGDDLLEHLVAERLAIPDPDAPEAAWSFAHTMLCESLGLAAKRAGRWQEHHGAYVDVLLDREAACGGPPPRSKGPPDPASLGRHLLRAGRAAEALERLASGAAVAFEAGDYPATRRMLADWRRAREEAGVDDADPRSATGRILHSRLWFKLGRYRDAVEQADKAVEAAQREGWEQARVEALLAQARPLRELGMLDAAWDRLSLAERIILQHEDQSQHAWCLRRMAQVMIDRGEVDRSAACFARAFDVLVAQGGGETFEAAACRFGQGIAAQQRGDLDTAWEHIRDSAGIFGAVGARGGVASCQLLHGEVHRERGELAEATAAYQSALGLYEEVGDANAIYAVFYIALVHAHRAEYDRAAGGFERARSQSKRQGRPSVESMANAALTMCAAATSDWRAFDQHLEETLTLLGGSDFVSQDVAWCAQRAGTLARAHGQTARARRALGLSALQWRILGREAERARVDAALEDLSS